MVIKIIFVSLKTENQLKMKKSLLFLIFIVFLSLNIKSQNQPNNQKLSIVITENGDTLPVVILPYVYITENRIFKSKHEQKKWTRLNYDVSVVYPYVKFATRKLRECELKSKGLSRQEQKVMFKSVEKEIIREFEDDIRRMSLNQGRILIKLIDRNTGNSSYELIKEIRGSLQAFMWQSVAKLFKTNLKEEYNPNNNSEDKMIEDIIETIEFQGYVSR